MSSPLCGTGLYANDVLCEVIDKMDQLFEDSNTMLETALSAVAAFEEASENSMSIVTEIDYDGDTSGIPVDYVASADPVEPDYTGTIPAVPTAPDLPTAPTLTTAPVVPDGYELPDADVGLISSSVSDDIFDRASEKLTRAALANHRRASYSLAAKGIGLASASLLMRMKEADQELTDKLSEAALTQSITEGEWSREDAKALHELHISNWPEKPKLDVQVWEASDKLASELFSTQTNAEATHYQSTVSGYTAQTQAILGEIGESTKRFDSRINLLQKHISSETERRGWSQMQVGAELEQADKAAAFALQKASAILEVNRATTEEVAKLLVGLAQGMWSSLGYSLGGSGSQSVSESV